MHKSTVSSNAVACSTQELYEDIDNVVITTDAGEEVVEAQTADDPQQNDVCEVRLVAPRDT